MSEVKNAVYEAVAEMLGMDESEIDGESSLIDVYKAESIDFLDISFKLNKQFGIKLYRGDFMSKSQSYFGSDLLLIEDGKLTQAGVDLLKARLPEAAENPLLEVGTPRSFVPRLYCANTWIRLVSELLDNGKMTGEEFLIKWLEEYRTSMPVKEAA